MSSGIVRAASEYQTTDLDRALAHAERLLQDSPELALEQIDEIVRVVGRHPDAVLVQARAFRALGDLQRAARLCEELCAAHPSAPAPRLESARLRLAEGRASLALPDLKALADRLPDVSEIWLDVADAHQRLGDEPAADAAYQRHVSNAPSDPELAAAGSALQGGRLADAEKLLRQRLRRRPTDVAAIRMLAELAMQIGRTEDAERLLARCVELAPGFNAARHHYAIVLHRGNQPEAALSQLRELLERDPANPEYRNLHAVLLCRIGEYKSAIEIYRSLVEQAPEHSRIWLSLGHALKTDGQTDQAIDAYRRSVRLDPAFGEGWWSLANLKTFCFSPEDLLAMRETLGRGDLAADQASQLRFALGKAEEDAGRYREAFGHYSEGNQLRHAMQAYRPEDARRRVDSSRANFTRRFFLERRGWGCPDESPIFVVGMPRAGSTLVDQILSTHPQVEGTMELPEVISITRELRLADQEIARGGTYHEMLAKLDADMVRTLGERYLERTRIHRVQGCARFVDKMPNNFFHIALIHLMLPNARIIDVRRHPMACCFSGFKQYFARGQNFSYSLQDIGAYYGEYVRLMAHYDQVLPGRVHRVIYERLVEDLETETRSLLSHCGLEFDPACLRFFENQRPVRTASSEQVRRPLYREGVDHWKHFEPWLEPLKDTLGPVLTHYPEPPPMGAAY